MNGGRSSKLQIKYIQVTPFQEILKSEHLISIYDVLHLFVLLLVYGISFYLLLGVLHLLFVLLLVYWISFYLLLGLEAI